MSVGIWASTQSRLGTTLSQRIRPHPMVLSIRKSGLTNSRRNEVSGTAIQLAMFWLFDFQYIMARARVAPGLVMSMLMLSPSMIW